MIPPFQTKKKTQTKTKNNNKKIEKVCLGGILSRKGHMKSSLLQLFNHWNISKQEENDLHDKTGILNCDSCLKWQDNQQRDAC